MNSLNIVGPTLIIESKTGISYANQCGGCACHHMSIEGYIFPKKIEQNQFTDPLWWYDQYGYNKKAIHKLLIHNKNLENQISLLELDYLLRCGSANGPDANSDLKQWDYWKSFCDFLESEFNEINLKVCQKSRQIEAWIHVETKLGKGIFSWENCD